MGLAAAAMLLVSTVWLTMGFPVKGQALTCQAEPASGKENWESLVGAGRKLRDQSHYPEAEQCLNAAVSFNREFGDTDRDMPKVWKPWLVWYGSGEGTRRRIASFGKGWRSGRSIQERTGWIWRWG